MERKRVFLKLVEEGSKRVKTVTSKSRDLLFLKITNL